MTIRKISAVVLLVGMLAMLLPACAPDAPGNQMTEDPEDLLTRTSALQMTETKDGYYGVFNWKLYYADKSDLTNWVLVCNKPDCPHLDDDCPAVVTGEVFRLRNDRIYTLRSTRIFEEEVDAAYGICSMALDGTDLRLEYPMDTPRKSTGGAYSFLWTMDGLYWSCSYMDGNGVFQYRLDYLDQDGMHPLHENESMDSYAPSLFNAQLAQNMRGDAAGYSALLSEPSEFLNHLYRQAGQDLEEIPGICDYELLGSYLDGDTLYHYVKNDGFQQTDLTTGKSKKRMDAQLADGQGYQLTPGFLVETNLVWGGAPETPELRFCRNGKWKAVGLPEGIWPGENCGLEIRAVTKDHLFFGVTDLNNEEETLSYSFYAVNLDEKNPTAVLCLSLRENYG